MSYLKQNVAYVASQLTQSVRLTQSCFCWFMMYTQVRNECVLRSFKKRKITHQSVWIRIKPPTFCEQCPNSSKIQARWLRWVIYSTSYFLPVSLPEPKPSVLYIQIHCSKTNKVSIYQLYSQVQYVCQVHWLPHRMHFPSLCKHHLPSLCTLHLNKIDMVGPVDNRPSTKQLNHFIRKN